MEGSLLAGSRVSGRWWGRWECGGCWDRWFWAHCSGDVQRFARLLTLRRRRYGFRSGPRSRWTSSQNSSCRRIFISVVCNTHFVAALKIGGESSHEYHGPCEPLRGRVAENKAT